MLMSVKTDRESLKIRRGSNHRRHIKGPPCVCPQTDGLIRAMTGVGVTGREAGIHPGWVTSTAQALCSLTLGTHTMSSQSLPKREFALNCCSTLMKMQLKYSGRKLPQTQRHHSRGRSVSADRCNSWADPRLQAGIMPVPIEIFDSDLSPVWSSVPSHYAHIFSWCSCLVMIASLKGEHR